MSTVFGSPGRKLESQRVILVGRSSMKILYLSPFVRCERMSGIYMFAEDRNILRSFLIG